MAVIDSELVPPASAAVARGPGPTPAALRRERLSLLASIIESAADAIITEDLAGNVTSWNPAAEKMYGYSAADIIGRPATLIVHPGRSEEISRTLSRIRAGKRVRSYEAVRVRKGGAMVPVSLTVSPIRDADGMVVGASTIARDTTACNRAQEQARAASDYSRSLIEASQDPLVTISVEGKVTDVNEATVKVTGVARKKLVGTDFCGYFTEPDKAREAYRRVFAEGSVADYPLTIRHRDGYLTDVLYIASVYRDAAGNVCGVVATAHDVTEQKQAQVAVGEQQERELDRMEELERFQRMTVGRELKMIELKRRIKRLESLLGDESQLGDEG